MIILILSLSAVHAVCLILEFLSIVISAVLPNVAVNVRMTKYNQKKHFPQQKLHIHKACFLVT